MSRSKKVFLLIAAIFILIVALVIADFSRRTTFPGKKSGKDTTSHDSTASVRR